MTIIILYLSTLIIFLVIDVIGITHIIRPVFERHVNDILADPFHLGPAVAFYVAYIMGVLYFVSVPALTEGRPISACIGGALLGMLCYGTYEFTNLATLRGWSWEQVVLDTIWGGALTGVSAGAGVMIARVFTTN